MLELTSTCKADLDCTSPSDDARPNFKLMAGQRMSSLQVSKSENMSELAASAIPMSHKRVPPCFSIRSLVALGIRRNVADQSSDSPGSLANTQSRATA